MAAPAPITGIPLNDGTTMPFVAFGSGTKHRNRDASKIIADAIRAGFRHIDCAQMYANEESVGQGILEAGVPRDQIYITTKLDELLPGGSVQDSLKASLERLHTDYVNMFLVHVPIVHPDLKAVWKEMEVCKSAGLTRSIGLSNFQQSHIEQILDGATVIPAVNQIEVHPYVLKASQPLLDYMKRRGILASSFGGLAPLARVPGGPVDAVLNKVANRLTNVGGEPVTQAQVLHAWLLKKGIPYVTTTANVARMKEYLMSTMVPEIRDQEVREIDKAGAQIHHRFVCQWIDEMPN